VTNVIAFDGRPQDGEGASTTGMSALRIITSITIDEFAAPGSPPPRTRAQIGKADGAAGRCP
jgi:hypothetical protein